MLRVDVTVDSSRQASGQLPKDYRGDSPIEVSNANSNGAVGGSSLGGTRSRSPFGSATGRNENNPSSSSSSSNSSSVAPVYAFEGNAQLVPGRAADAFCISPSSSSNSLSSKCLPPKALLASASRSFSIDQEYNRTPHHAEGSHCTTRVSLRGVNFPFTI